MKIEDGKYEAIIKIGDENVKCKIAVTNGEITNWHTDAEYKEEDIIEII